MGFTMRKVGRCKKAKVRKNERIAVHAVRIELRFKTKSGVKFKCCRANEDYSTAFVITEPDKFSPNKFE